MRILLWLLLAMPLTSWAGKYSVDEILDSFHLAASEAKGEAYFGLMADDAIFLGTDATERWTKSEFQAFAMPYFADGKGWTYVPKERRVIIDKARGVAWFDEILNHKTYGECRGSGVLSWEKSGWKIRQYHLTIPIPNTLVKTITGEIKAYSAAQNKLATEMESTSSQ